MTPRNFLDCVRDVAIVGNAPPSGDRSREIDAADFVVRFNNAQSFGSAYGNRISLLALVNRGGQAREWAADESFSDRRSVRGARGVLFPFPELSDDRDGVCFTRRLRRRLNARSVPSRCLSNRSVRAAVADLDRHGAGPSSSPSTGYLTVHALLPFLRRRGLVPRVFGFGFAGWSGHAWDAERDWFLDAHRNGQIVLADTD